MEAIEKSQVIAVQQTLKGTPRQCLQKEWNRFQMIDNVSNKVGSTGNRLKKVCFPSLNKEKTHVLETYSRKARKVHGLSIKQI